MAGRRAEKAEEKVRRKAPLGREEVVGAALGLLDEVGLDGLTTRRLAERLGVRVGALYWHVSSKQELLAAVADRIMEEFSAAPLAGGDGEGGTPGGPHGRRAGLWRGAIGRSGSRRRRIGCGACSSLTATARGYWWALSGLVPTSLWSRSGSCAYCGRPAFPWRWRPTGGMPSPASSRASCCRSRVRPSVPGASRRSRSDWPRSSTRSASRISPSGSPWGHTTRTGTSTPSWA